MPAAIPQPVQAVLHDYTALVDQTALGLLAGLYLHGSIALGAYVEGRSDIDFIAVTAQRCTADNAASLRMIHEEVVQRYPHAALEGSYLCWSDLGQPAMTIPPGPYIHDGVFVDNGSFDINDVTWWVLKNRGIAVRGPAADQLNFTVDWETLVANMYDNLNSYWAQFTTDPPHIAWLSVDEGIEWAVLGVLRQFSTFRQHDITSKMGAGQYALAHTPTHWHPLIRDALAIRAGTSIPAASPTERATTARDFIAYIINTCNDQRKS